MKKGFLAMAALALTLAAAAPVYAAEETPLDPAAESITAQDAITGIRSLYSQMQHYADVNDNAQFAALFEDDIDSVTVESQLQSVKSSLDVTESLSSHADVCFIDPTEDKTVSPYYFAAGLTDYAVAEDGSVEWYSTLIRAAYYESGWKASAVPSGDLVSGLYPEGYTEALVNGRNAVDFYPYFANRFSEGTVFQGALYSLVNMAWQNEDGSMTVLVWIANGTDTDRWCDSIDVIITDSVRGAVTSVNMPVQYTAAAQTSQQLELTIPAENVKTDTNSWNELSVDSNLIYQ